MSSCACASRSRPRAWDRFLLLAILPAPIAEGALLLTSVSHPRLTNRHRKSTTLWLGIERVFEKPCARRFNVARYKGMCHEIGGFHENAEYPENEIRPVAP